MVYAKTSKAASRLSEQMKNGGFEKRYLPYFAAFRRGKRRYLKLSEKKFGEQYSLRLHTDGDGRQIRRARLRRIKEGKDGLAFAEVNLHTGRTHQIRVQFASINTPVYGDMRYGGEKAKKGKLALWAYSLRFTHPVTGEAMRFIAEPPEDGIWQNFSDIRSSINL